MAVCEFCKKEFEPKKWFRKYCSIACKSPANRKGHVPWNKGLTVDDPRVLKNVTSPNRISPPSGWNKGNKTEAAKKASAATAERMRKCNPNHNGVANLKRKKIPQPKGWKLYIRQVAKFTRRSQRRMLKKTNIVLGKKQNDWQLDHVIPLVQGFKLNIPPYIMGNKYNIQILKQKENRSKWGTFQSDEMIEIIISTYFKHYNEDI